MNSLWTSQAAHGALCRGAMTTNPWRTILLASLVTFWDVQIQRFDGRLVTTSLGLASSQGPPLLNRPFQLHRLHPQAFSPIGK